MKTALVTTDATRSERAIVSSNTSYRHVRTFTSYVSALVTLINNINNYKKDRNRKTDYASKAEFMSKILLTIKQMLPSSYLCTTEIVVSK